MQLPPDFVAQMQALLPDYAAFALALDQPAPVAVRLNPFKTGLKLSMPDASLPWCRLGYPLPDRPVFALDPRWHAGAYYVQDASCMLLEAVLEDLRTRLGLQPERILDACAAPGGKATHLASLFPDALVLANEVIRPRAAILAENCSKWGSANLAVSRLDPAAFAALPDCFDLVLADVPCSGEGLFRKDLQARAEWSLPQVELCARRQRRILEELWTCLRPGGILLYSTCTYNHAENEQQLAWLRAELGAEPLPLVLPPDWPVLQSHGFLRCYPQLMPGEGFFLGAVLKPDGPRARLRPRSRLQTLPARESAGFSDWLSGEWGFGRRGDTLLAWPQQHLETITLLQQLKGVTTGMELAEIKGKSGLHPLPELALSVRFSPGAFPQLELSLSQAIAYLQGQALYDLPAGPPGHGLACFDGWALGWLKRVEQRANNLYPQAWRLRMRPAAAEVAANWEQLQRLLPLRR